MTLRIPRHAVLAAVLALAAFGARAADADRAPCTLRPSADEYAPGVADGATLELAHGRPLALANWDVRWWQRHRLWITLSATNHGDAPATLLADAALDRRRDGSVAAGVAARPLVLAPHAVALLSLPIYVTDDARAAGVRLRALEPGADVAATLAVVCSDRRFDTGEMAKPATALLDEALKIYFAELADPLRDPRAAFETVRSAASGAQDSADVAWAMRQLMQAVHDDASTVLAAGEAAPPPAPSAGAREPQVTLRNDGTAVLRLFPLAAQAPAERQAAAARLQAALDGASARRPRAWIVDLRELGGGDLWAALAPLSALLDGPSVGAFVGRAERQEWIAERGAARIAGDAALVDLQAAPKPPFAGPVALLIGPGTAGTGESLAVAFIGRAHTRSFGAPSAGRDPTALREHVLADGTRLRVLAVRNADRLGTVHRGPLEPDTAVASTGDDGVVPSAALEWVQGEHAAGSGVR